MFGWVNLCCIFHDLILFGDILYLCGIILFGDILYLCGIILFGDVLYILFLPLFLHTFASI